MFSWTWWARPRGASRDRGLEMRAAVVIFMFAAACSSQSPTEGGETSGPPPELSFESDPAEVAIVTTVDPGGALGGTFRIEEGAAALGCSSGTYVDSDWDFGHRKTITCEAGGTSGTFTVNVDPDFRIQAGPPERWTGSWGIDSSASTGDLVGLQGFGVFEVVFRGGRPSAETLSGEIYG